MKWLLGFLLILGTCQVYAQQGTWGNNFNYGSMTGSGSGGGGGTISISTNHVGYGIAPNTIGGSDGFFYDGSTVRISSTGQVTTPTLYVNPVTNMVGFGTTEPSVSLHTISSTWIGTSSSPSRTAQIKMISTGATEAVIRGAPILFPSFSNVVATDIYTGMFANTAIGGGQVLMRFRTCVTTDAITNAVSVVSCNRAWTVATVAGQTQTSTSQPNQQSWFTNPIGGIDGGIPDMVLQKSGMLTISTTLDTSQTNGKLAVNGWAIMGSTLSNTDPSQTLHISGTLLTTSWTGINFSNAAVVTPTAPLEVLGTISATAIRMSSSGAACSVAADVGTYYDSPNRRSPARCNAIGVLQLYTSGTTISASQL